MRAGVRVGGPGGAPAGTHTCFCVRGAPRIVAVEQDNKMTPGNLGIVFGPTLLRPRPTEATVSLSSLVDYPHQARIVETLITHYGLIFEEDPEEVPGGQVKVGAGPRAAPSEQGGWDGEPWFQQARQEGPQRHL